MLRTVHTSRSFDCVGRLHSEPFKIKPSGLNISNVEYGDGRYFNEDDPYSLAMELCTRHTLSYCSRLFTKSRNSLLRGVDFLSECKTYLSEVISKMVS